MTTLLAWQAGTSALTGIARVSDAATAIRFGANDPVALTIEADAELLRVRKPDDLVSVVRLAEKSLSGQALNARALRILAYSSSGQNDYKKTKALIQKAVQISRREFGAQLWLIEDNVRRNDTQAILSNYDIALRTSTESREILFPILSKALSDPSLQVEFARFIKTPPIWLQTFLESVLEKNGEIDGISSAVIIAGGLPSGKRYRELETALLAQLSQKGKYAEARMFFKSMPGSNNTMLDTIRLDKMVTNPRFAPITWQALQSPGVAASFDAESGDNNARALRVQVGSGERGVAAKKITFFSPGSYLFTQEINLDRVSDGASVHWELNCLQGTKSRLIWRSDGRLAAGRSQTTEPVLIPADCAIQAFQFVVAGGADQAGADLTVRQVSLTHAP